MKILSFIYKFCSNNLVIIHNGAAIAKVKATISLAVGLSPIAYFTEKIINWTVTNEVYVLFVLMAIILDHLLGIIIHLFIKRDFTFKKNIVGLLTKIGLVVAMGFLFEGVNAIVKEDSFIKNYLTIVLRLSVFLYPAGSAFMNSATITKGKFPPIGWINKIKKFQENLSIKELKDGAN